MSPELPLKLIKQYELGRLDKESLEKKTGNPNKHTNKAHTEIDMYRVSLKTVATFIFGISRLPRGLEIPFFNSPFCVDFKNIQFSII